MEDELIMRSRIVGVVAGLAVLLWAGAIYAAGEPGANTATPGAAAAKPGAAAHHAPHAMGAKMGGGYHGGKVFTTNGHTFETVFAKDGVRVYVYSAAKTPQLADNASGTATLKFKDGTTKDVTLAPEAPQAGDRTVYFCTMHPDEIKMEPGKCPKCGMDLVPQNHLFGAADLSQARPGSVTAEFKLTGLAGDQKEASFTENNAGRMRKVAAHSVKGARGIKGAAKPQ